MYNKTVPHINDLLSLGIINESSISEYADRVRDREDVKVLKCEKSGVIFLNNSNHISQKYYENKEGVIYWSASSRSEALKRTFRDDKRRKDLFIQMVNNKDWLDVGTGLGGILDLLGPFASRVAAVELQEEIRKTLKEIDYEVYAQIKDIPTNNKFEVITLFHVFEHLFTPLKDLKDMNSLLKSNGKIIIEVPHASDFLLKHLSLSSFASFTLWSEHLILHTRKSLELFLKAAGFHNIRISGYQRYPLSNHLYWLSKGKPGGHDNWFFLDSEEMRKTYGNMLSKIDMNDTLIAIAEKE